MQQSNREVHNLNFHRDYCGNRKPVEAFYEMLTNGRTADPTRRPVIRHDIVAKKVSITDCGPGILKEHFVMGRSRGEGHSNHGIGLKDAIAILRRDYQATITIRSGEFRYTFTDETGSLGGETLHLVVQSGLENFAGTQIDVEYKEPGHAAVSKDIAKAQESFLEFFKVNLKLVAENEHLEMYVAQEGVKTPKTFDYIFVLGVRIRTRHFRCVYNIKGRLAETVKSMVSRDHHISDKERFKQEILPKIQTLADTVAAKPEYSYLKTSAIGEFQRSSTPDTTPPRAIPPQHKTAAAIRVADPQLPAPRPPVTCSPAPQCTPGPAEEEIEVDATNHPLLASEVFASLDKQNSTMFTLMPGERKRVLNASNAVKRRLQQIPSLSIARIGSSGSIAKNTAVPHSVDVDMVVFLNNFQPAEVSNYACTIKDALASRDCRFLSSADDILECVYGSVNIDIVLTSAADIDHPRYREFQSGPDAVTYFKESIRDNAWVAEVVRAAKYWVMRCNDDDDLRVKSLAVELVVLEVYKACEERCASRTVEDNRKALFVDFLQFLTRQSDEQRIPNQPKKEDVFEEIKKPLWRYQRLAEAALQDLQ